MAEPKRFDIHKVENFLKNSADKAQTLSYWNAAVEHGKTVKEIDENLASNVDDKQIADLLLRRTDAINRRDRLIKAVENAIKVKYQPQIPEIFSTVNKEMQSRLAELQQQSSCVGRVQMLMSALQDENQILNYLDLDEKKRAIDRLMDSNKKLREDSIANGKIVDEEDYAAACQELLQKRSDIKTKIEDLLKTGEGGAILRSLEDAEQRLADVRASVAADKSSRNGTSPQKEPEPDEEQKEDNGHNADDSQERNKCARSLQIEELSIHSRSERAKSNKTSVISKTSSARRVLHLELKALKEQEELQSRLEKLRRETKQKEMEIADLQGEVARKARIAEKEIELAKFSSSCGTSLRSISPVESPDDNLTKVSDWMDKTEEAENVASPINVPSVYQQTSASAPVITVRSTHEGQRSGLVGNLKPSVKPTISTEAAVRGIGKDRTKTVIDVVSQRATAQPEVKFASSKPSMTLSAEQNQLPPTSGGIPSGAFQVPQFANTQMPYLPSQGPNIVSNARDDYFIRSSLPKLKLAEFSGDPLEWPEWSQLFQATVHAANIDDSVKMNHLKTMVTGKAKEAIAGLGYTAEMYNVAWNVLVRNFGKPQMVVNAQLKRIYSFPPMKPYDGAALIKFARIVSSCVNVLTQFNYVGDLNSEGVLGSATRKLTLDMKTKWLTHVKQMNLYQPGLAVFSEWLNDIADVQDELLFYSNPNADRAKTSYKEKAEGSTFATSATNTANDNSKTQRECVLKDGQHPIWKCEKFKKMNVEERGQKAKELKLCFKCLSDAHQMRNCSGRLCDVNGCGKPHHRLLHRPYKNEDQKQNVENIDEVSNLSSMRSNGVLPVIPVSIGSGSKTVKTFALCDSGASLSFVDESLMKALNLMGQPVDLNVAGIHGASNISSKRLRVRIGDQQGKVKEDIMAYSHPDVNAGNRTYNLKKLKEEYPHLSVLKDSTINLKDVKVILGQDCYHLHRAIGYRKCGKSKPWAVLTKLGWMLSGNLPQQETAKFATESLVFADVDPLVDQMKTRSSMEVYTSHCSVSEMSKENTENSPDIFVVERNWQEVSTKPLLLENKQVWQDEMHLAVSDHMIVEQDKNMGFSIVEEKTEHESFAIKSNLRTLEEFTVMLELVKQNTAVASVRQHVEEKQQTQMQAVKFAAQTLTLEEGKKCSHMNKVVEVVKECQLELHEVPRRKAIYRRPFGGLWEQAKPTAENASNETKSVNVLFGRKHDVELKEKLLDRIIPNDSENCNNWLGNGNSGMDAVAQANPNVYTQLSTGQSKQFEKRAWKFEPISIRLHGRNESAQLNTTGILYAKIVIDEFADEISQMETRLGSSKAQTTTNSENGPFIGPAALWEKVMMQRDSFGKCIKEEVRQLEVNDLVWIVDDNVKRAHCKMGRVLEVYHGSDGRVRSALVKTEDGKLKRPIVKLAPMFYESVFRRKTGPAMLAPVNCEIRNSNSNVTDETYNSKHLETLSRFKLEKYKS